MRCGNLGPAHAEVFVLAFAPLFSTAHPGSNFLYTTYDDPAFARDVRRQVWESATVTYVALNWPSIWALNRVILVGVDHNSMSQAKPIQRLSRRAMTPTISIPVILAKVFAGNCPTLKHPKSVTGWHVRLTRPMGGRCWMPPLAAS